MKEFDKICKEVENMDVLTYGTVLADKALTIIPVLNEIN